MKRLFVKHWLIITLCLASITLNAGQSFQVSVRGLIAEEETVQPGRPFWVGLQLELGDHWHIYWKNPGDVGMAPSIEWTLPDGFSVETVEWPYPTRFEDGESVTFGYENEIVFLAKINPPESISSSSIDINASMRWIACSDTSCLPGSARETINIPVDAKQPKPIQENVQTFAKAREKIPQQGTQIKAFTTTNGIELHLTESSIKNAYYFPENSKEEIDYHAKPTLKGSVMEFKDNTAKTLKGVVVVETSSGTKAYQVDTFVTANLNNPTSSASFGWAMLFAFAGGMILNLMPCVLPVVSFKILSFVKISQQSRSKIFKHGLAFSAGILLSFWVLAGLMLILQAYGRTVGWGFQLQEPLFVAILAAIIFVFSLSLFGLFEIGAAFATWAGQAQTSSTKTSEGLISSFFGGVFATTVATPCTGPFLGTAIGFAFTMPPFFSMLIFTSLGLGMALPYIILCGFPQLLRFLPKPGNWMIIFKEIMGFIMLATVLWLFWVFGAQTNTFASFLLLTGLFILALGCWIYGRWGLPVNKRKTRLISYVLTLACFAGGIYTIFNATSNQTVIYEQEDETLIAMVDSKIQIERWMRFSPERLAELRAQGKPVFVDFTAKWCLICQANHFVLSNHKVHQKMAELGVVKMKADWTKRDPTITQELRKYGRNGVPLYLLYGTNPEEPPKIFPQVLTPDTVLNYLSELK